MSKGRVTLQHESDALLVERIYAGNQKAFETLVQRYQDRLRRFVCLYLSDMEGVQDVMQFVWLQLYLSMPKLLAEQSPSGKDREASLKPWLFQVAKNRCFDEHRKRRRPIVHFSEIERSREEEYPEVLFLPDPAPQPEECVEREETRQFLVSCLTVLPTKFRSVVYLRHSQEELTFREIGQRLQIPEATAKTYYYRACAKLRAHMQSLDAKKGEASL